MIARTFHFDYVDCTHASPLLSVLSSDFRYVFFIFITMLATQKEYRFRIVLIRLLESNMHVKSSLLTSNGKVTLERYCRSPAFKNVLVHFVKYQFQSQREYLLFPRGALPSARQRHPESRNTKFSLVSYTCSVVRLIDAFILHSRKSASFHRRSGTSAIVFFVSMELAKSS